MQTLFNFRMRLDLFGGDGWVLSDTVDYNGFCNVTLTDLKPEHYHFCLSIDHDSFFDCLHFHGVTAKYLTNPKLASTYKPWETRKKEVMKYVEDNREEFIAEVSV